MRHWEGLEVSAGVSKCDGEFVSWFDVRVVVGVEQVICVVELR
jgi:hypothetical protein